MYKKIKKYSVEGLLIYIGELNLEMFNNGSPIKEVNYSFKYGQYQQNIKSYICSWELKDIAYNSVKYSNDYRNDNLDLQSFYKIINEHREIEDKRVEETNTDSIFYLLYGLSQQQFWYQQKHEIIEQFNRNMKLLKYIPKELDTVIDIEDVMRESLGISVDEYIDILLSLLVLSLKKVDISDFVKTGYGVSFLNKEHSKILKVIELYTTNYKEIRDSILEENIFLAKPIVKTDKGKYIIPNIYLMFRLLSDGLYWIIRNYYYNQGSQIFTNEFGKYFEKYVENLFEFYLKDSKYYKPNEIKGKKIADWVIEVGEYIIVIEQKSMIASLKLKKPMPDIDNFNKYVNKYNEAFEQLNSTEKEILNQRKDKKIIKLILHYDSLYSTEMLKEEICKNRIETINEDRNTFFISIREVEILSSLMSKDITLFNKIIEEKLNREYNNSLDGRTFDMIFNKYKIINNSYLTGERSYFKKRIETLKSMANN